MGQRQALYSFLRSNIQPVSQEGTFPLHFLHPSIWDRPWPDRAWRHDDFDGRNRPGGSSACAIKQSNNGSKLPQRPFTFLWAEKQTGRREEMELGRTRQDRTLASTSAAHSFSQGADILPENSLMVMTYTILVLCLPFLPFHAFLSSLLSPLPLSLQVLSLTLPT